MKEKLWDFKQAKAIQAICILGIMLHHLAQKTCAPWLSTELIRHGLDFFVPIGYLFVAVFFFSSGYGLLDSYRSKENYLDGFIGKHFGPILLIYIITEALFWIYGSVKSPYTWYVVAILCIYLVFFLSFRYCKKTGVAIAFVALGIILYCIVCDWMVLGSWWINTIGIFLAGLLYAVYEDRVNAFICKNTILKLLITVAILIITCVYGDKINSSIYFSPDLKTYTSRRFLAILLEYVSGLAMVLTCLLISVKVRINSKFLSFVGSMTLEIYLVHGFFVELFGFSFVSAEIRPLIYIENVWLYTAVVFACTMGSAYLLKLIRKGLGQFARKEYAFRRAIKKDGKIALYVLLGIVVLMTVVGKVKDIANRSIVKRQIEEYKEEHLQFADVNGKNMAVYIAGDGETVVVLKSITDPCPTIAMKRLADELATDYRVVVLDYLGSGFSDTPDTDRNIVNITNEIHSALQNLGINDSYTIMAVDLSGFYAQYYAAEYPDEVKMVINVDAESAGELKKQADRNGESLYELLREMKYDADTNFIGARLIDILGWKYYFWPAYKDTYVPGLNEEESRLAEYFFFDRIYNRYIIGEFKNLNESIIMTRDMKYAGKTDVVEVVSTFGEYGKKSMEEIYTCNSQLCKNMNRHHYEKVEWSWYCLSTRTEVIKSIADKYLG